MQLIVGHITRAHGVRGEVLVGVRTDEPEERFAAGSVLDTDQGPLTVAASRWHSGQLLVRFNGVSDRNGSERLRGLWLRVDSGSLPPTGDPDEFRDHELIGLAVQTVAGEPVGEVADVLHLGQDVLQVRRPGGGEVLVPFVKAIVPDIDMAAGVLRIDPPPGLIDPEEAV